jgi:hypothetical protein
VDFCVSMKDKEEKYTIVRKNEEKGDCYVCACRLLLCVGGILTKFLAVRSGYNQKRWSFRVHPEAGRIHCQSSQRGV